MPKRPVATRLIRSAADERAIAEGCWYDERAGQFVVDFFDQFLVHTMGQWAGKPFTLLDWQRDDVVLPLFGWKRADGTRRYRKAYIEVPKKNGKSSLCAGLALFLLIADGEPRAQVFGAASDREQAGIVFTEAANMVAASSELSDRVDLVRSTKRITDTVSNSFYHAISADAYSNEGLNAHAIIFDELHAQKTRDLWDALRYATASRRQPLLISITTAGYNRESICYEQHSYAEGVLKGHTHDSSFFGYIKAAEHDDDWTDPVVWRKANPSFGITIQPDQFAEDCQEAQQSPRKESAFRRYRLNQWVSHSDCWFSSAMWDQGAKPFNLAMLDGKDCYLGVDLARKRDIAAVVLVCPMEEDFYLVPHFFLPKGCIEERERQDHVAYSVWAKQGLLTLTDGGVIDYLFIREYIKALGKRYRIEEIGYDPWNAELLCNQQLGQEDGFATVEVRQNMQTMGPATAEFEKLMRAGRIHHGRNPILSWMAGNCVLRADCNDNVMPTKKNSTGRIDGIMASIIGVQRAILRNTTRSIYETRGVLAL